MVLRILSLHAVPCSLSLCFDLPEINHQVVVSVLLWQTLGNTYIHCRQRPSSIIRSQSSCFSASWWARRGESHPHSYPQSFPPQTFNLLLVSFFPQRFTLKLANLSNRKVHLNLPFQFANIISLVMQAQSQL